MSVKWMRLCAASARRDSDLAALAARLTAAEAADGDLAGVAWEILGELADASRRLRRAEDDRDTAVVMMRAAVADARDGSTDPLAHVRRYLTPRGQMPRTADSSLVLLAWGPAGPPPRPCPAAPAALALPAGRTA